MHYLTRRQYASLKGISRQAVQQGIAAKKIPVVMVKIDQERIPVEDTEVEGVNLESLTK